MTPRAGGGEVCFQASNCVTAPRAQLGSTSIVVALLSRAPSDSASTMSDVTLYPIGLAASKSEKWDDWSDISTEVDTTSFMSGKSSRCRYNLS